MKTKKFLVVAMASLALIACNDKKDGGNSEAPSEVTSLTLNLETADLPIGETLQLVATVTPAGTAVTWSSSAEDKATVDENGLVTGVAEGRAMIIAKAGEKQAACIVTVGEVVDDLVERMKPYLEGSNYYLFAFGEKTAEKLAEGAIKQDLRFDGAYQTRINPETGEEESYIPDETHSLLEVWDKSFDGGDGGGLNSFGLLDGYISLISAEGKWGSAGYCGLRQIHHSVDLTDIHNNASEYTLVITYKCSANNANDGVKFTLESCVGETKVEIHADGNTGGDWKIIERSMAALVEQGLNWSQVWSSGTEGQPANFYPFELFIDKVGQGLDVDAIFIYKKKQ